MRSAWNRLGMIATVAATVLLAGSAAQAGPKDKQLGGRGPGVAQVDAIDHAAATLALDDKAKADVHQIVTDATAQATEIREKYKGQNTRDARQAMRAEVMKLVQETAGKVEALLNDDQKAAFKTALQEERKKLREERASRRGDKPAT